MVFALRVLVAPLVIASAAANLATIADVASSSCDVQIAQEDNSELLDRDAGEECDGSGLLPTPIRLAAIIGLSLAAGGTLAAPTKLSSAVVMAF